VDNAPVPDARIEVSSPIHGQVVATQYTEQDGSFTINNVPAGAYEVRAESGTLEAGERVQVDEGQTWVTVRMPTSTSAAGPAQGSAPTVSVQQLQIPQKAASLLHKAQEALTGNKLDAATKYVAKALETYPEYAEALALRGVLKMQSHQFDQASVDANHAIHADPNNGMGYLVMGAALNAQQKFQDALRPLQRAELLMPNAWQSYFESGKALVQLGKFQDALREVNKAFTLTDPSQHPDLYLVKGYAYMGLRVYGPALTQLEQYVSKVPAGPHAAEVRTMVEKIRPLAGQAGGR
jgi:Flp pilus assembly protein TadD